MSPSLLELPISEGLGNNPGRGPRRTDLPTCAPSDSVVNLHINTLRKYFDQQKGRHSLSLRFIPQAQKLTPLPPFALQINQSNKPIEEKVFNTLSGFPCSFFPFPLLFLHCIAFSRGFLAIAALLLVICPHRATAAMGNRFSLCSRKTATDDQDPNHPSTMAKEVVYQTTPFEGQKPGTSGKFPNRSGTTL